MLRNTLKLPDEYTTVLGKRLKFDLSPESLATRSGKEYIARMAENVSLINIGLTTDRKEFLASGYLRQKEFREAYLLYYMTTNLLKVVQPLQELSLSNFFDVPLPIRILDLGTGTGTAAWGVIRYLQDSKVNIISEITLTDFLDENLHEAENFSRFFHRKFQFEPKLSFCNFDLDNPEHTPEKIKSSAPFQLITIMNVLNELEESKDASMFETIVSLLSDDGAIIMIEPATRMESRRLLRFRDLAVSRGATIYSPCTRSSGCPALVNEDDWCHTDIAWERPAFIKAIDDVVGTLRLSLKSTYLILRKDGVTLSKSLKQKNLYRIVSERFDEKGRVRAILCGENGRYEHVINKRDFSKKNREFADIERYDVASLNGAEVRDHDIKLLKESEFSLVLPVLGAR